MISLLLLLCLLLFIPAVQNKIVGFATQEISKTTGSHISIGRIHFQPFNKLEVKAVYAEDQKGDTLLYVDKLSAGFNLFQLLDHRLRIESIRLDGFLINVQQDSLNGSANYQFLLDAFASDDTVPKPESGSSLEISIDRMKLSGGRLLYTIHDQTETDSVFNPYRIQIHDFSAALSLRSIDLKRLNVVLDHASFREKSGFQLKNLHVKAKSEDEVISIEDFSLELPHSQLKIPSLSVDYTDKELSRLGDSAVFATTVQAQITPSDLRAFYMPLQQLHETLSLEVTLDGSLPSLTAKDLNLSFGDILRLRADVSIEDYIHWEHTPLTVQMKELFCQTEKVEQVLSPFVEVGLPEMVHNLGNVSLQAELRGTLPALRLKAGLDSRPGKLTLEGMVGYTKEKGETAFDVKLSVPDYNLFTLMQDTLWGKAGLQVEAKGQIDSIGNIRAKAGVDLLHLVFNTYTYQAVRLDAGYENDSISVSIVSGDENVAFTLNGGYFMPPRGKSKGHISACFDRLALEQLRLLPDLGIKELRARIEGAVEGNSPDEYIGGLSLDSLQITTGNGVFSQEHMAVVLKEAEDNKKSIHLRSDLVNGDISGHFSFETIAASFSNAIHRIVPSVVPSQKVPENSANELDLSLSVKNTEQFSEILSLPFTNKKEGMISASFRENQSFLQLQADFPLIAFGANSFSETKLHLEADDTGDSLSGLLQTNQVGVDTTRLHLTVLMEQDSVDLVLNAKNHPIDLEGSVAVGLKFVPNSSRPSFPDLFAQIRPTSIVLKKQSFEIGRSFVSLSGDRVEIQAFKISHPNNGSIRADGIISSSEQDSLIVGFEHLHLAPLAEMIQYEGVGLGAVVNGGIVLKNLYQSPFFITDDLTVKEITVGDIPIGDMNILSAWSEKHQGLLLNVSLKQSNQRTSTLKGFALPYKDSLSVKADIRDLELSWAQPFVEGALSDLKGKLGVSLAVSGKISNPTLDGFMYLNKTSFKIGMTNVTYSLSDSVPISKDGINFQRFAIRDKNNHSATLSGKITHANFEKYKVDLKVDARNFLLLNNPEQKDSLLYGTLQATANLNITGSEKGLDVDGTVRRGTSGKFFLQLPDLQAEAGRYENIVYINTVEEDSLEAVGSRKPAPSKAVSIPIKVAVDVELTPDVQMGVIINPSTRDAATVKGNGNLQFRYNTAGGEMKLMGDYTVTEGQCVISLKNITKKEFSVQEGSQVTFKGDPLATTFDVTAIYTLRADLATLDQSFSSELSNTRVNTNCVLNVSGDINKMQITYDLKLPDADESIQRKVSNYMYSDDIKIKNVAYLLALGSFFPQEGNQSAGRGNLWTSLASSTLSSQLNNLLSGVLNENWSIGTSLHSNDNSFSDVEMDVNVSTSLFNNRLLVNTNLGYRNNATQENNITGDFLVEYKLTRSGALRLKAYNVTNDEYFKTSLTTQGLGVVYKKQSKTFKELFRSTLDRIRRVRNLPRRLRQKEKVEEKDDNRATNEKDEASDKK